MPPPTEVELDPHPDRWRQLALGVVVLGCLGTGIELLFLEHYEDPWQWTPIALLGIGLLASAAVAWRADVTRVRLLQVVMGLYLLSSGLGIFFHLKSNVEFERELNPAVAGTELIVKVLKGAMPALAPGAMAQLGLLGLLVCFRHPSITTGTSERRSSKRSS